MCLRNLSKFKQKLFNYIAMVTEIVFGSKNGQNTTNIYRVTRNIDPMRCSVISDVNF